MSTPHQAHNIPWSILTSHVALTPPSPSRPNITTTRLTASQNPRQSSDINHFDRRFAATVREFAQTERAKYPERIKLEELEDGKVIPDSLLGEPFGYDGTVTPQHQDVSYWVTLGQADRIPDDGAHSCLLKQLHTPAHMKNLLFLVQLPESPLPKLRRVTYSNFFHYGTDRVWQDALMGYILVNVHISMEIYGDRFEHTGTYDWVVRCLTEQQDYNNHMRPQQQFFGAGNERLQDVPRFKAYLKETFWRIYAGEMVVREMDKGKAKEEGREPRGVEWEKEVRWCLESMFGFEPVWEE